MGALQGTFANTRPPLDADRFWRHMNEIRDELRREREQRLRLAQGRPPQS